MPAFFRLSASVLANIFTISSQREESFPTAWKQKTQSEQGSVEARFPLPTSRSKQFVSKGAKGLMPADDRPQLQASWPYDLGESTFSIRLDPIILRIVT